jgi:hypothetical protein
MRRSRLVGAPALSCATTVNRAAASSTPAAAACGSADAAGGSAHGSHSACLRTCGSEYSEYRGSYLEYLT